MVLPLPLTGLGRGTGRSVRWPRSVMIVFDLCVCLGCAVVSDVAMRVMGRSLAMLHNTRYMHRPTLYVQYRVTPTRLRRLKRIC